jgi:hypothetical protein
MPGADARAAVAAGTVLVPSAAEHDRGELGFGARLGGDVDQLTQLGGFVTSRRFDGGPRNLQVSTMHRDPVGRPSVDWLRLPRGEPTAPTVVWRRQARAAVISIRRMRCRL